VRKPSRPWHALPARDALRELATSAQGLDDAEAARRRRLHGPNEVDAAPRLRWTVVLLRQFADVLTAILAAAAALSLAIGDRTDAATILAILLLNAALGFAQEWKAERATAALQQLLAPWCTVLRAGAARRVAAQELVPGDVVLVSAGDRVPADLRLIEAAGLRCDESALTGESRSVPKETAPVAEETPLFARSDLAFAGTVVATGRGRGLVIATGAATEFGGVARLTREIGEERTPLQARLAQLGRRLGAAALAIATAVAVAGWLSGRAPLEMLFIGVALAVAAVPEGLPAVVTIALALGVRQMARRRCLVRRLQAAETLGATSVICTDKTGTITRNEMVVSRVWLAALECSVSGRGYEPAGEFHSASGSVAADRTDLRALLETAAACNDAAIERRGDAWHAVGEPTEAALVAAAAKAGVTREDAGPRAAEFPFQSDRKRMSVVERAPGGLVAHVKGAPEVVLARCTSILDGGVERPLLAEDRERAAAAVEELAASGLRTLALARRALPESTDFDVDAVESRLTLLGIVGMLDPPRDEVPAAVALARAAGVRVIVVTGDAAATAAAVARRIGLPVARVLQGPEIDAMDDAELDAALRQDVLFARTTPRHKLRIVTLLQQAGHVVAMTGDGVNDAPALKKADVGIGMGMRGTDVARGASDLILTDDDFASIVAAVEEGRRQFDNIRKFVRYLLSSNVGEIVAISASVLSGGPLVLLPVQVLWMNLVTDGPTAASLAAEPKEHGLMRRPPRRPDEPVVDRSGALNVALIGLFIGAAAFALFRLRLHLEPGDVDGARTVGFTALVVFEKVNVLNFRALRAPLAAIGWFTNRWVLAAVAGVLALQVAAVSVPVLQDALHTIPLRSTDWMLIAGCAVPIVAVREVLKSVAWRRSARLAAA
jgi:Ca2+-transporting ATPase